jgi:glyoxylase-like metal-dependent hydrolase (beta-lactamase superfamily II)
VPIVDDTDGSYSRLVLVPCLPVHGTWQEIADRVVVGRYRFYDQEIGAVIGADGVLVVDSRSAPPQAREIVDDLRALTRLPVRWFVNTHWHYDHTFGNAELRPAEGWGHVACAAGLRANFERMRAELADEVPGLAGELARVVLDPPERTFEIEASIDLGADVTVELRFLGRGHTNSDIVVSVPGAGVLFVGDLLENGAPPYFGDGYPMEWPGTIERCLPLVAGPVVPGHGDVGDKTFVEEQLGDLRAIARLAQRVHDERLTVDDVLPSAPWGGGPLVREALERALAQLQGAFDAQPA